MSYDYAISLTGVSKEYQIYDKPIDRLKEHIFRGHKKYYREFWALKDITLKVRRGETVGIVGRNGSGKSTLLQIISGTLLPTAGEVNVKGRIAALLELGSGFNPEFTGRENVLMNGAILGMNQQQMEDRLPAIERFAEIGDFIDQPVKLYSSGMFVRLAFACAVNVDPDILIIDEALAVGDLQFQLKCIEKMKSFQKAGKTILFVSHDIYAVRNFCNRSIWMMDGHIHMAGEVNEVIERYEDFMKRLAEPAAIETSVPVSQQEKKSDILTITDAKFFNCQGKLVKDIPFGQSFSISADYTLHQDMPGLVGGIALFDRQNTYVCGLNTKLDKQQLPREPGKYRITLTYADVSLLPGTYYIDVGFFEDSALVQLDFKVRYKSFRITSGDYFAEGVTYIDHQWYCERIE